MPRRQRVEYGSLATIRQNWDENRVQVEGLGQVGADVLPPIRTYVESFAASE
jgi:hypothetical protein